MKIRYSELKDLLIFLTSGERIKGREYRFYLNNALLCYQNFLPDESKDEELKIKCDFHSDIWNIKYKNEVILNNYMLYTILEKLYQHFENKRLDEKFEFICFDRTISAWYDKDVGDYIIEVSINDIAKSPS